MDREIDALFRESVIKISDKNLAQLESMILDKIRSIEGHDALKNLFNCEWDSEAIIRMRQFFINPELYGVMNSENSRPEIFTITTKPNNSHYEGLFLNSKSIGAVVGETGDYCATKIIVTYLDLYGSKIPKTILDLNKDLSNSKNMFGRWKNEENIQDIADKKSYIKENNGTVYIERNTQDIIDARVHHPVRTSFIINNYKAHLLMLKENLDKRK